MFKYFKVVPLFFLIFFAMMCYGSYALHILFRMFWHATDGNTMVGVLTSLLLGVSATFIVAAIRQFFAKDRYILGASMVYAGTFICCWLYRFGVPFLRHTPSHLSINSNYSILLITSLSLLALHFAIEYIKRLRNKKKKQSL